MSTIYYPRAMLWRTQGLLAAAGIMFGHALRQRVGDHDNTSIADDEIAYVSMIRKVCLASGYHGDRMEFQHHMQEGSWAIKAYNSDKKLSSAVWQNEVDGRCVLAFSGYHGHVTGYLNAAKDLTTPRATWKVCDNEIYSPWVKLLRQHSRLENWTRIANTLGGSEGTCKGELLVAGESAGGPVAETLAACMNGEHMYDVLPNGSTQFHVHALYTLGGPATSKKPITNPLHPSGCFRGKRFFNYDDDIAFFMGVSGLVHPMYDAVEIWEKERGPTFKVTPCLSQIHSPIANDRGASSPAVVSRLEWKGRTDVSHHEVFTYENFLKFFRKAGYGELLTLDLVEPGSSALVSAVNTRGVGQANETAEAK